MRCCTVPYEPSLTHGDSWRYLHHSQQLLSQWWKWHSWIKEWHIMHSRLNDPWSVWSRDLTFLTTGLSRNNARWTAENAISAATISPLSCHTGYNLGQEPWPQHTPTCSQIDTFIQNTANEFQNQQTVQYALRILYQCSFLPGNCPDPAVLVWLPSPFERYTGYLKAILAQHSHCGSSPANT